MKIVVFVVLCLVVTPTLARHRPPVRTWPHADNSHVEVSLLQLGGSEQNETNTYDLDSNHSMNTTDTDQTQLTIPPDGPTSIVPESNQSTSTNTTAILTASIPDATASYNATEPNITEDEDGGLIGLMKAFMGRAGEAMKFGDGNESARRAALTLANNTNHNTVESSPGTAANTTSLASADNPGAAASLETALAWVAHLQSEMGAGLSQLHIGLIVGAVLLVLLLGFGYLAYSESKEDNTDCGTVKLPRKFYLVEGIGKLDVYHREGDENELLGEYVERIMSIAKASHIVFRDKAKLKSAELSTPLHKKLFSPWRTFDITSCTAPGVTWKIERRLLNLEMDVLWNSVGSSKYKIKRVGEDGEAVTVARMVRKGKFSGKTSYAITDPDDETKVFAKVTNNESLNIFKAVTWEVDMLTHDIPPYVVGFVVSSDLNFSFHDN